MEYRSPRWQQLSKALDGRRGSSLSNRTKTFTFQVTSPESKRLVQMVASHTRGASAAESAQTGRITLLKSPDRLGPPPQHSKQPSFPLVTPQELMSQAATPHASHQSRPSDIYSAQLTSKPSMQLISAAKQTTAITSTSKQQSTISKRPRPRNQGDPGVSKRVNFELAADQNEIEAESPQAPGTSIA